jgi:RNA polymerase sigma factor for flagellar operon FliA
MSRRIPGRRPALVGSAQLRSSASQGLTQVQSVPEVEPASLNATDPTGPHMPADTASVGTRARRLAPAARGPATYPADLSPATQPTDPDAAPKPTDLSPAVQPAGPRSVGQSAGPRSVGQPADLSPAAQHSAPTPAGIDPDPGTAEVDTLWSAYLKAPTRSLRDRLVVHYTPLVRAVAHRVAAGLPTYVDQSDLVQSGVFGLIDAVIRFDPARCPRFESYAAQRIRGAILDELRAQDWVPRSVRGRAREMERAQERLEGRLLRGATDRELAAELGVSVRDLAGLSRQVQLISVEALYESSGGVSELLADDDAPDPMAVVQARETLRHLSVAVGQLGERDQTVIRLYYLENRTLAEIGSLLGVTESRVCQLHSRLVGRLRGRLEELAAG